MSRRGIDRLHDVIAAIDAISAHLRRGSLSDELVFDAVRFRLIEIGEAVKDIPAERLARQPQIPWAAAAGMRDHRARRYFDTSHAIVTATVQADLPLLREAAERLLAEE